MNISIFLIFVILPMVCGCSGREERPQSGESYITMTVDAGDISLESSYPAILCGRQSVEIRPQVSGMITDIRIDEGSSVRKGQVMFVIDQVPYKAALETARANVKSAEVQLNTATMTADSKKVLLSQGVISDFDYRMAYNAVLEAEAALAEAEAQETEAENNLSYTEVKSPVDGVTGMIPYRVGSLVGSDISEPLVTVSDDSRMYAYFSMSESQVLDMMMQYGSIDDAMGRMPSVDLELSNGKAYGLKGKIDAVSGTVDAETGAVRLRAVFDNPDRLLRSGGSASVVVPVQYSDCIIIPQSATYELQNLKFVWKIVDGKTESVPVSVVRYDDGKSYIVESGLHVGDTIVAEGAGLVREGVPVQVSPEPHV